MGWNSLKFRVESKKLKVLFKTVLGIAVFLTFHLQPASAQTWSEWFRQKKTQNKYQVEQVIAWRMYAGYVQKGYRVAKSGLGTIRELTDGEFKLHEAFSSGLRTVNPVIKGSGKMGEILEMQLRISSAFSRLEDQDMLSASNRLYVASVREGLWKECLVDLEDLLLVVTSGKLEMTDAERLERLDKVYQSMRQKSAFAQHFCSSVRMLVDQRRLELRELRKIGGLYGY